MRGRALLSVGLGVILSLTLVGWMRSAHPKEPGITTLPTKTSSSTMKITSSAFSDGGTIPSIYTCDGNDTPPPLQFDNVPNGTVSLALIVEDPDVPQTIRPDGMWDHWILWNIPSTASDLSPTILAQAKAGTGTSGKAEYMGPCPPHGAHHYIFRLIALDTTLSLPSGASKADLLNAVKGHILAETTLTGLYARQ